MLRACLCLLAGMLAPQLSSFPRYSDLLNLPAVRPVMSLLVAVLVPAAILAVASVPQRVRHDLAWFVAGCALFCLQADAVVADRLSPGLAGDSLVATVRVVDFPVPGEGGTAFLAAPEADARLPRRLRLRWFEPPVSVRMGDIWTLELRLQAPSGVRNPGGPDFDTWMLRDRSGASGYVAAGTFNRLVDSGRADALDRFRDGAVRRIESAIPEAGHAAVIAALTAGTRHLLTREQWDRFAATGTSHLMAISGLHIGLVGTGVYGVCAAVFGLAGLRRAHDGALVAGLAVAAAYAVLSGFAIPARRALIMLALFALAILARRGLRPGGVLAAAAVAILVLDPLASLAPGFQLSFAAVAVLLWVARRHGAPGTRGLPLAIRMPGRLAALQCLLLAGLAPLTVLHFDRLALAAPAVNLVAVPLFSLFTVPAALAGVLLSGPFQAAGDALLAASGASVGYLDQLLVRVAAMDSAAPPVADRRGIAWLCLLAPLAWACLPPRWPGRLLAWIGLAGLVLWRPPAPPPGCLEFVLLDVGQGLAAVIRTHRHVLLYDTGPAFRSGGDAGSSVVVPYLQSAGIRRVDRLLVSHSDLDHAGGLMSIAAAVRIGHVASGDPLPFDVPRQAISRCRTGDAWTWDGVRFRILHPSRDAALDRNDASCVLQVDAGSRRFLLAGDIESAVEAQLVRARVLSEVDVTIVPHHGSRTSSITPYVRALNARYALVAVARYNAWNLPKADIIERWRNVGATVLSTATSGAVAVAACAHRDDIELREYRLEHRRRWHGAH